jgi:hypothetical protein
MLKLLLVVFLSLFVYGDDGLDELLDDFGDEQGSELSVDDEISDGFEDETLVAPAKEEKKTTFFDGFSGYISEQSFYGYNAPSPHNDFNSLRTNLFLDYEHKFENNWKFKINTKAYYDAIYDLRSERYSSDETSEFRHEIRLYDAYLEGGVSDNLDFKIGRQVVVWGRSDTIRITDILNPLDNRRPGIVDIEDLRLPTTMAKFDYYIDNWRITPIAILEQQFSLNPPYDSVLYPFNRDMPDDKEYYDTTFALSVGSEFKEWDVNFYAARVRNDEGYIPLPLSPSAKIKHPKISMYGRALNYLYGSWLFKTELAYLDELKYTTTQDKELSRLDSLIGLEYNGISETMISYDVSLRHFTNYDKRLKDDVIEKNKETYQHALRVTSDFINDTLHLNYLISLYGENFDEGGYQRAWLRYDIDDELSCKFGVVDYIGGDKFFDAIRNSDMVFVELKYSF